MLVNSHTLNDRKGSLVGLPEAIILPNASAPNHGDRGVWDGSIADSSHIIASKSTSASVMVVGFWCLGHYSSVTFFGGQVMQYGYVKFIVLEV